MKTILVPVDGSECADRAIDQAIELAQLYKGKLVLLHVIDDAAIFLYTDYPSAVINYETLNILTNRLKATGEQILTQAKARCAILGDNVSTVSLEGNPVDMISEYASRDDIDLVVMGSHGRRGIRHSNLGSTTHKIAAITTKPLLIIR